MAAIKNARSVVEYMPILGILGLATFLAFYHLGDESMWLDEAASFSFASKSWSGLLDFWWDGEANMGLYYAALKVWTWLFGTSEVAIRSLSVLPAVGTVWVTWRLGLRLFGARTAFLAALILSLNAYFLQYAQEARPYSLMTFLAGLSTLSFIRALERSNLKSWLLYIAIVVIGIYVHWFVALMPVAYIISLVVIRRKDMPWRYLAIGAVVGAILITPILLFLTRDTEYASWVTTRGLRGVASLFYSFAGQNPWLLASYFLASCVAVLALGREYYQHRDLRRLWPFVLVASLLFTPIVITVVVDYIRPIFVNRYVLFCLPP